MKIKNRAEREQILHSKIHVQYVQRREHPVCVMVDQFWYGQIFKIIKKHIPQKDKLNIVDLGAGTCLWFEYLKNSPGITYTGIDISPEMIRLAQGLYKDYDGFSAKVANLDDPFLLDHSYDVYGIRSLIHHLSNQKVFLDNLFAVMPSGTLAVISEPNNNFFTHMLREVLKKLKKDRFDQEHFDIKPSEFSKLILSFWPDVQLLEMVYFGYLSYPFSFPYILALPTSKFLVKIFIAIDKILSNIPLIRGFSWHTIYVVRKK